MAEANNPVRQMVVEEDVELAGTFEENIAAADKFDELVEEAANIAVDFDIHPEDAAEYMMAVVETERRSRLGK